MWRRYLGEFFDVSSRLWCVGKPYPTAFQRSHSRQDPPSCCAAIAPFTPLVASSASPGPISTSSRYFRAHEGSVDSPRQGLSNKPLSSRLRPLVGPLPCAHRPPPPHHPHPSLPPYLLDPWTVSGRSGLVPIASTSSLSPSHRLGTTSRCVLHQLRPRPPLAVQVGRGIQLLPASTCCARIPQPPSLPRSASLHSFPSHPPSTP